MPHSEECKAEVAKLEFNPGYYCIGGCRFTREDAPDLYDLLTGSGTVKRQLRTDRHMPIFEVTEDHLKLVQRTYWTWNDRGYDGAPAVGLKRPYGNSDVGQDIAEILGWDYPDEDEMSASDFDNRVDDIDARAMKIHREMEIVLQIATCTLSWEPGRYQKMTSYDQLSWRRVDV